MDFKNYYIVAACLLSCSIALNAYGIKLLCKRRNGLTTQGIILVNLSVTEVVAATIWLLRDTVLMIKQNPVALRAFGILMVILINVRIIWYLSMFMILLDRCFACNFPFQHMTWMTRNKIKITLAFIWAIFTLSAIIFAVIDVKYFNMIITRELFMALAGLFVLLFFVTYSSIFCKMLRAEQIRPGGPQRNQNSQFIRVTGLILVTFLIFDIVPSVMGYLNRGPLPSSDFLHATALLTDPIIYILFQRDLRSAVGKSIRMVLKDQSATNTRSGGRHQRKPTKDGNRICLPDVQLEMDASANSPAAGKGCKDSPSSSKPFRSVSSGAESGVFDVVTLNSSIESSFVSDIGVTNSSFDSREACVLESESNDDKSVGNLQPQTYTTIQINKHTRNEAGSTPFIIDSGISSLSGLRQLKESNQPQEVSLEPSTKDNLVTWQSRGISVPAMTTRRNVDAKMKRVWFKGLSVHRTVNAFDSDGHEETEKTSRASQESAVSPLCASPNLLTRKRSNTQETIVLQNELSKDDSDQFDTKL